MLKEEKSEINGKGKRLKSLKFLWILVAIVLIVIGILIFTSLFKKECKDLECFNQAMEKCSKSFWISEAEDASWQYTINGKEGRFGCFLFNGRCEICSIDVKLLQVKKGTTETGAVEGLDMVCKLPLGLVGVPNSNLERCHGDLKEGLQDLMIKKMHAYIISNIGEIGRELSGV